MRSCENCGGAFEGLEGWFCSDECKKHYEDYHSADDEDDESCEFCGKIDCLGDRCGAECGRWVNGKLTESCSLAGTEQCDFECPFRDS